MDGDGTHEGCPSERPNVVHVDPEKMLAARKAGASPWEVHERAFAGEFAPAKPYDPRSFF
jgi:catechol 2,3-dioxygenase